MENTQPVKKYSTNGSPKPKASSPKDNKLSQERKTPARNHSSGQRACVMVYKEPWHAFPGLCRHLSSIAPIPSPSIPQGSRAALGVLAFHMSVSPPINHSSVEHIPETRKGDLLTNPAYPTYTDLTPSHLWVRGESDPVCASLYLLAEGNHGGWGGRERHRGYWQFPKWNKRVWGAISRWILGRLWIRHVKGAGRSWPPVYLSSWEHALSSRLCNRIH